MAVSGVISTLVCQLIVCRIYADQHSGEHFIPDMSEVATYLRELYGSGHGSSTSASLRNAFQLASLLSPMFLCVTFHLDTKSFSRRLALEIHSATAMRKSALALEVESLLMEGLIRLSDGNISPYSVLSDLVDKLPWAAIETASNNEERRLFNFAQGSVSLGRFFLFPSCLLAWRIYRSLSTISIPCSVSLRQSFDYNMSWKCLGCEWQR